MTEYAHIQLVEDILLKKFPYFAKVVEKRRQEFGEQWMQGFDAELAAFFSGDGQSLARAVEGYGRFALDGMKLQKKFDKDRKYIFKKYEDVAKAVYLDKDYMLGLYLPGIYLSHYLWPHHFRQLRYFHDVFVPMAKSKGARLFYDVGVGTGFYSKELLRACPDIRGRGFDISPFSLEHAARMASRFNLLDRYKLVQQDVLAPPPPEFCDVLVNVEVLEHLENPLDFLKGLHALLRPQGLGFITAAITAPNADHIYLYQNLEELCAQIEEAGFTVLESAQYQGYDPKPGDSVPINGICIVTKG